MTSIDGGVDYVSAPATYEDLHRTYYDYVVSLVRQAGIEEDSKEDVASSILTRLYERDILSMFDPTLVFMYNGEERGARFKSFLSKMVLLYVRGHRERQTRRRSREMLFGTWQCEDRPGLSSADEDFWLDYYGGLTSANDSFLMTEDTMIDAMLNRTLVVDLRAHLSTIPRRSKNDLCDLVALFDAIVDQVEEHGCCDPSDLRQRFAVSPTSIHSWLWWLRANVAAYLDRPLRPKRVRVMAA